MKTSVIDVRDMLSVLSVLGVEERIGKVPGVESVTVNFAAETATVRYDETRLEIADIKSAVRQSAYEADGESLPEHASGHDPAHQHAGGHTPGAAPASTSTPDAAAPKPPLAPPAAAPTHNAPNSAPDASGAPPASATPK